MSGCRKLLDAQAKAAELFRAIEEGGLIAPGVRESAANDAIRDLAADMFGISRYWHKRIVRAGANTLQPYRQNPPTRTLTSLASSCSRMSPAWPGRRAGSTAAPSPGTWWESSRTRRSPATRSAGDVARHRR
jgi:hypothetical protein